MRQLNPHLSSGADASANNIASQVQSVNVETKLFKGRISSIDFLLIEILYSIYFGDRKMAKMTVYHGGYEPVTNPEIRIGRNTKDFGAGFYCTIIKEQAQRWAKRYDTKVVSIYEVRLNSNLRIKDFKDMTDEWLDFIIDCRSGKPHDYDIVIGAMANDQIYNYVSDYMEGAITREQFWILAKFKYPTHQINFCTNEALKCLEYRGAEEVL